MMFVTSTESNVAGVRLCLIVLSSLDTFPNLTALRVSYSNYYFILLLMSSLGWCFPNCNVRDKPKNEKVPRSLRCADENEVVSSFFLVALSFSRAF